MAASDPRAALRNPGRLVADPTNLSAAFPYGGTELGLIHRMRWRDGLRARGVAAEEYGGVEVEYVVHRSTCALVAVLRGWDADAIATVFPGATSGTSSGRGVYAQDSAVEAQRAGARLTTLGHALLFAPLAAAEHPGVLIYRAVPTPEIAEDVQLSLDGEFERAVAWRGVPDDDLRTFQVALIEDMTL
jgi:hypothetical protein